MRRVPALSALAFFLLCEAAGAQEPAPRAPGEAPCVRTASEDAVASVSDHGELRLVSGRTIRLLDIRLPADEDEFGPARARLQALQGRRIVLAAAAGAPDRWGRIAAEVSLAEDAPAADIAARLVDEGLAIVDAGERRALCRPDLLAREERARSRRNGIWSNGRHGPLPADDTARLREQVGRFALVVGRVRSVGERRERTYLNFGPDWTSDLTVTVPKRAWAAMLERGLSAAALRGRIVRARGIIEEWQGVAVEITAPDMLEVLGQDVRRP